MTEFKLTCEVCNKNPAVGVASGACGAVIMVHKEALHSMFRHVDDRKVRDATMLCSASLCTMM